MNSKIIEKYKKEGLVVPATYDVVFKAVMQDEKCRDYLIEIIHMCTKLNKDYIRNNMVIRNTELPVSNINEKRKINDLIIDIENNVINLEMNRYYYDGLIERNDIYLNSIRNLKLGEEYINIPKVIQINFNNFDMYDDRTIIKFMIMDEENHIKETENYEKYHINLNRIRQKYYNKEKLDIFEKRLLILCLDKKDELKKVSGGDEIMKKVEEKILTLSEQAAMILCYDEEEHKEKVRRAITRTEIRIATEKAVEEAVGKAVEKATKKAVKKGLKEGIKEGRKEGLIEGRIEGKVEGKIETAKELLKNGIDINIIASCTGVSIDKIKNLSSNKIKEHQK